MGKKRLTIQAALRTTLSTHALPKFRDGSFRVVVEKVFPWTEIVEAHSLMEGNGTKGKIVCRVV